MHTPANRVKLSAKETAELLRISRDTLRAWRARKVGPPYYRKVGRIFYLRDDVERWELSNPGN